jgi:hypothetical protein
MDGVSQTNTDSVSQWLLLSIKGALVMLCQDENKWLFEGMMRMSALYDHSELDFYSSLNQQFTGRDVAPLGNINLTFCQKICFCVQWFEMRDSCLFVYVEMLTIIVYTYFTLTPYFYISYQRNSK